MGWDGVWYNSMSVRSTDDKIFLSIISFPRPSSRARADVPLVHHLVTVVLFLRVPHSLSHLPQSLPF